MAKYSGGILGSVSGKTGGVVFARSRNQDTVRAYQPKVRNPRSAAQRTQRFKMQRLGKIAKQIAAPLKYINYVTKIGGTGVSQFISDNYSLQAASPNAAGTFLFANATISRGSYDGLQSLAYDNTTAGVLIINYDSNPTSNQIADDVTVIVIMDEDADAVKGQWTTSTVGDGMAPMTINRNLIGKKCSIYAVVKSATNGEVSTSQYVGTVILH